LAKLFGEAIKATLPTQSAAIAPLIDACVAKNGLKPADYQWYISKVIHK